MTGDRPEGGRSLEGPVVAALLLAAPLILLFVGRGATFADLGGAFSPMFFPTLVLWFWAGVAGLSLAGQLLRPSGRARVPGDRWARIGAVAVLMAGFVWLFTELGFLISGVGFTLGTLLVLGIRAPLVLAAFSLLVPGAILVLFHHLLGLPLPTSPFSYRF